MNQPARLSPVNEITPSIDWALAEILRLNAWMRIIANCKAENTAEERYARRVRHSASRAMQGDKV